MMDAQSSRLQLTLSAKNLANLSGGLIRGRSDPFCVVTVRGDDKNGLPIIVGETEIAFNNLNPTWATVIFLDGYRFGVPFYIEIGVFDYQARAVGKNEGDLRQASSVEGTKLIRSDSTRDQLRRGELPHAVMGTALFEVGQVMSSRGMVASKALQTGGKIYVHLEKSQATGGLGMINLQLKGNSLTNTAMIGRRSNPFFELCRKVERASGATWTSVFRSNVVKSSLNPKWGEVQLSLEAICNSDLTRPMKIVVYDFKRGGTHKVMGEVETTMERIVNAVTSGGEEFAFVLRKPGVERHTGKIIVLKAEIVQDQVIDAPVIPVVPKPPPTKTIPPPPPDVPSVHRPQFVEYLAGGCQISLAVAIDFTASNGNPREPGTPHYFSSSNSTGWNDYQKALFAVGSILAQYDADQRFPVWGFGAKYDGVVRHCFQCGNDVEVEGVPGLMEAYRGVFNTPLTMSYPTDYTEVIRTASMYAMSELAEARNEGKLAYTILLILTAGKVETRDVQRIKRELVEASDSPLSVVIVGIGISDFSDMEFLDDHDHTGGGRDITKFVNFKEYDSYNKLTEAVLDEIPDQLVDYYYQRGVMPGEAETTELDDVPVADQDDDERTYTFLG